MSRFRDSEDNDEEGPGYVPNYVTEDEGISQRCFEILKTEVQSVDLTWYSGIFE